MRGKSSPGRLLIVEDNQVNRLLLTRMLEQSGHQVSIAVNGLEAMALLRTTPFDVMLLDLEMPEMNGMEVLQELLHIESLRHLPVIITSASSDLARIVSCIEMGAEDYLFKPLQKVLVLARVNASLEKKRLRDEQAKLFRTFTTPEVAEKLLREGFSLGGQKIVASVMFADIRAFTALSEQEDPAEVIELINGYFAFMFEAITANNGTVNQMQGDGLMAIFGAPVLSDNHREHAVKAAMQMIEQLKIFNAGRVAIGKSEIQIGIGIATGSMVAGYTGTQNRAFYTCLGDVVNIAARLESFTKVAQQPILIDQDTLDGLGSGFVTSDLGDVVLKGKANTVRVFSVKADS
jgi:adenylate cyclase